jgi:hypothetical protein
MSDIPSLHTHLLECIASLTTTRPQFFLSYEPMIMSCVLSLLAIKYFYLIDLVSVPIFSLLTDFIIGSYYVEIWPRKF